MQKFVTKKRLLTLCGVSLFVGGLIYAAGPQIIIDPTRFVSQQKIQQINLNSSGANTVKEGLVNKGIKKPVLLIGNVSGDDVKQVNTISGEINTVIGGTGNINSGRDETSFMAGGFFNKLVKKSSVILGGNMNEGSGNNSLMLASSGVKLYIDNGVVMGISNSDISGYNSIGLAGNKIFISNNAQDSVAIGSNITVKSGGMFIFNGGNNNLEGSLENSVVIKSDHGLVVGGPKMVTGTSVKLTVHGGISLGSMGSGQCNLSTNGAVYYTVGKTNKGGEITCVCFCANSGSTEVQSLAVSNQPYCDVACKNTENGGSDKIDGSAKCGNRGVAGSGENIAKEGKEMVYEYWETKWRDNSNFCSGGAIPFSGTINNYQTGDIMFPGTGEVVSWVCPGLTAGDDVVQCNAYKKEIPPKCGINAIKHFLNDKSYTGGRSEISFCEIGVFTGISPYLEVPYGGYPFPEPGNIVKWGCKTNSGHLNAVEVVECSASHKDCNHCAVNGFPYCFDIDFDETCPDITGETPGTGLATPVEVKIDGLCEYGKNGASCKEGTVQLISNSSCEYEWKCVSNNGGHDASCSMSYTPDKTISTPAGGYYQTWTLLKNSSMGDICGAEGDSLNGSTYNTQNQCEAEMKNHFRYLYGSHMPCNLESSECVPCMHCEPVLSSRVDNPPTTEVKQGSCVVEGVLYPSDDLKCSGIAPSCPASSLSCVDVCMQYKKVLTNQFGCNVTSIGNNTYGDLNSCWSDAKAFGAVRSQSYGIGSTSWNKGDPCDIDTDPYCVPCVSCSCLGTTCL